ncbi:DUF3127 domain-containing protein [Ornithobacterium rhinotracheale]|uniref:DUF3127 domain-containing protein n=1 Tax=Ornithobacterium rhinotracheale (strain ATCC 51463 / DSM 15997 / CCUG 23171 / CIP 104009 / LMG 9086) TaxID=867902 RepID=I4A1Q8_ORNRL|nr:DUF3127 domain-containing protein [Ornithobacterium rhinotracheale]AFL97892.1 Protein of unknown function (DUF3127) [Ornithobacterium rhinotracheale DSM 15997]AIP99708.1 hypothetical protein Q785_08540 [Ornithobacterium rhinotracheale ORT-UMN 88]KGB65938.1 hypothetical protein Q787_08350 [Ornithobacterium rhinotracheale H06-030791]MBN3661568.1 DUF3127 domain-containing protein [Ornithobacterium rhinotracheale]MCK0193814.1 DUF3127 domain-containing protein [Ornithobacterium rhinotracheale]
MEVVGKVKKILEPQTFNSGFTKQEVVILTQEQYPQTLAIEFLQDKVNLLTNIKEGDDVKISINLRGREWVNPEGVTKYFNSITGWRIEPLVPATQAAAVATSAVEPTPPSADSFNQNFNDLNAGDDVDDLPF